MGFKSAYFFSKRSFFRYTGGIVSLFTAWVVSFLFLLFTACSAPADRIGSLDLVKWRGDRGGCKNVRKTLEGDFKKIEKEILGKHIDEVGFLLGRPDIHQLGGRDQKFYIYFLEKGVQCDDIMQKSVASKLTLRFNAVGLLAEITFQARPL